MSTDAAETWEQVRVFATKLAAGSGDVRMFLQTVPVEHLAACLQGAVTEGDADSLLLASRVLRAVLESSDGPVLLERSDVQALLSQGLHHPHSQIRHVCATTLLHHAERGEAHVCRLLAAALLPAVVETLKDEDVGVALAAVSSLVAAASALQREGLEAAAQHVIQAIAPLAAADEGDGTVQLRALEGIARISAADDALCQFAHESGALRPLVDLVTSDDVLLQMNALHLVARLGETPTGLRVLLSPALLSPLLRAMGAPTAEGAPVPPDPVLAASASHVVAAVMRRILTRDAAVGAIVTEAGAVAEELPERFMTGALKMLSERDAALQAAAVKAVAAVGSASEEGLRMVTRQPALLNALGETALARDVTLQANALEAIAAMAEWGTAARGTWDAAGSTQSLLLAMARARWGLAAQVEDALPVLAQVLRELDDGVRHAAFTLLRCVAAQRSDAHGAWGAQAILRTAELMDLLLSRHPEPSNACYKMKREAIQALLAAPSVAGLADDSLLQRLREARAGVRAETAEFQVKSKGGSS